MDKSDLLRRLNTRSTARYRGGFPEPWLNDLMKDGLLHKLDRGGNEGLAPRYFATARHYRRALQLKRLHSKGIATRDAQLLQLFVRGYGVGGEHVGEPLRREFLKAMKSLNAQLRSSYFQNDHKIGPGHAKNVSKQLGQLDERLIDAGLLQLDAVYVDMARGLFGLWPGASLFPGLLNIDPDKVEFPGEIEAVFHLSPRAYEGVRDAFIAVDRLMFRPAFSIAAIDDPRYVATLLTLFLIMSRGGFSFEGVIDKIPEASGFLKIAETFKQALRKERSADGNGSD